MKKVALVLVVVYLAASLLALFSPKDRDGIDDRYVRTQIVQLESEDGGSCTGVKVRTKNGPYILTAAHCASLAFNGRINGRNHLREHFTARVVAISKKVDLMLLTTSEGPGLNLGARLKSKQVVYTMTHGGGFPAYRTVGEVLCWTRQPTQCTHYFEPMKTPGIWVVATAYALPGSSGGALIDLHGDLVGIVVGKHTEYENVSYSVSTRDIRQFLDETLGTK